MIEKLKLRESNADAISKVIRSRVVRDKLDEFRDNFYGDGTYAEKFGNEVTYHDITDVKCTIDDVWTEVLGNPGIWDIICHADVKWDWDEDTDTVGTQESFSFYYDPATDTIVDDADIHTMEQDMIPLVGESNKKVNCTMIRRLKEGKRNNELVSKMQELVGYNKECIQECKRRLESIETNLDIISEDAKDLYNTPVPKGHVDILPMYLNVVDSSYEGLYNIIQKLREIHRDTESVLD